MQFCEHLTAIPYLTVFTIYKCSLLFDTVKKKCVALLDTSPTWVSTLRRRFFCSRTSFIYFFFNWYIVIRRLCVFMTWWTTMDRLEPLIRVPCCSSRWTLFHRMKIWNIAILNKDINTKRHKSYTDRIFCQWVTKSTYELKEGLIVFYFI